MDMNLKFKIVMLSTGGTIEKTYDEVAGSLENRESIIQKHVLSKLRLPYTEVEVHSIMSKDSLHMTESDRRMICDKIHSYEKDGHPIVIIHGTDTMTQTLYFCSDNLNPKVPVIFTGAMRPQEFEDSDALQNVSEALLAAKILKAGFYIAFHNRIFSEKNIRKNPAKVRFELY